jgi:AcrR family transcriptional regulator
MNTKDKIIKYAQYRIYNDGFIKLSIDELSKELRISKNTVYKHFKNKDDIILTIVKYTMNSASEKINIIFESNENAVKKLTQFLEILIKTISGFSEKFINDIRNYKPEIWQEIDENRKKFMFGNLNKLIKQGIKEKLIRNYPEEIIVTMIISSLRSVVNPQFIMTVNYSREDIIDYSFQIITNGILTKKGIGLYNKIINKR